MYNVKWITLRTAVRRNNYTLYILHYTLSISITPSWLRLREPAQ